MLKRIDQFANKILGQLRKSKKDKTWNTQELSQNSGLSIQAVYALASGQRGHEPEFRTVLALASAMGWTMQDFISEITCDDRVRKNKENETMIHNMNDLYKAYIANNECVINEYEIIDFLDLIRDDKNIKHADLAKIVWPRISQNASSAKYSRLKGI